MCKNVDKKMLTGLFEGGGRVRGVCISVTRTGPLFVNETSDIIIDSVQFNYIQTSMIYLLTSKVELILLNMIAVTGNFLEEYYVNISLPVN